MEFLRTFIRGRLCILAINRVDFALIAKEQEEEEEQPAASERKRTKQEPEGKVSVHFVPLNTRHAN